MRIITTLGLLIFLLTGLMSSAQKNQNNQWFNADKRHKDNKAPVNENSRQISVIPADTILKTANWKNLMVGDKLSSAGHVVSPAGTSLALQKNERVMNVILARNNKFLIVKTDKRLAVIDANGFSIINSIDLPDKKDGGSMYGLAISPDDSTVYVTGRQKNMYSGQISNDGKLTLSKAIDLSIDGKYTNPLGIGLAKRSQLAFVALAVANRVAVVDLNKEKAIDYIPVGICPYAVAITKDESTAFVSNFGGPIPCKEDRTEKSAGSDVAVDNRSVALRGSVTVIDIHSKKMVAEIYTRIYPESMVLSPDGLRLYVTDASGDGISVIDVEKRKVIHTISTKPDIHLPYGSLTTGLAFSQDGKILFAANAGNNAIALINPKRPNDGPYGFIAAGGFPGTIATTNQTLFIGNVVPLKGSLQKVSLPTSKEEADNYSREAEKGFHLIDMLRAQSTSRAKAKARPVPEKIGDPSTIKHVVYIIKENKKFDQVLGDFGKGNCDPKLVEFGRNITPNTHALASHYVLLDNYYCNGILSSDGHQWAVQGITTPYREKDFAGGHCAYDFGTDPLCYAGCGFIWDHLLRKGISFRNFGELDLSVKIKGKTWTDFYQSWKNKDSTARFECRYYHETISRYSDMRYPGWQMDITDQIRADAFLTALSEYESQGSLPEFIIIYLPNDHTQGYSQQVPTPRAYVADNDLATGRIVEALSKSSFWKDMAIFINEDDPQTGTDHVDGHRSFCLLAGPYVRQNAVVSTFYNQSSVLHTICQIFGVQPMNQIVAMAPLMTDCFRDEPDFSAYALLVPGVAINEMNPDKEKMKSKAEASLAPQTEKLDFSKPDLIDKNALLFSQYVWATIHGDKPFPSKYFGAHGRGLKKLGLKKDSSGEEDEDD